MKIMVLIGLFSGIILSGVILGHIYPVSKFNFLTGDDEIKRCWALSNLQPLWARDNLIKHARVV